MKKQGGKRKGAGRKPLLYEDKKTTIRIYIKNKIVDKLGGHDKLKSQILDFIDDLNKENKQKIDYKEKYYKLYENTAKMLVNNYRSKNHKSAYELLSEWDRIRHEK